MTSGPVPGEWWEYVRLWSAIDPKASAADMHRLLGDYGFTPTSRAVRKVAKKYRPILPDEPTAPGPRPRRPDVVNAARAVGILRETAGETVTTATAMVAYGSGVARSPQIEKQAEEGLQLALKSDDMKRELESKRIGDKPQLADLLRFCRMTGATPGEHLGSWLQDAEQVRKRAERNKMPLAQLRRPIDPSPPCRKPCDGLSSPHRHCVVCRRAWSEEVVSGFGPLFVPSSFGSDKDGSRQLLTLRMAVESRHGVRWTTDPPNRKRREGFIWACDNCRRAAAEKLPPSLDRDELLSKLPRVEQSTPADYSPIDRMRRRYPGLAPWCDTEGAPAPRVLHASVNVELPGKRRSYVNVKVRLEFARYVLLPQPIPAALLAAQDFVELALPRLAERKTPPSPWLLLPGEKGKEKTFVLLVPGLPSLGVVSIVLSLKRVRGSKRASEKKGS